MWILLAIVVLMGILFSVLERNLQETSETLAEYYSRNTATEAMTQGIEEVVAVSYTHLSVWRTADDGRRYPEPE